MYFYQYYAAGCKPVARDPQGLLFGDGGPNHAVLSGSDIEHVRRLRNLTGAPQHAGLILHDLIAQSLRHPDWQEAWFLRKARERFADEAVDFVERFNQLADAEERIERAGEHLLRALRHFFEESYVRALVAEMRSGVTPLVEWPLGKLPPVRGFRIQGRVDYCSMVGSRVEVVDWKMGTSAGDEDSLQLAVYGLWACRRYSVSPERVRVRRVYLGDGKVEESRQLSPRLVLRAEARLGQDVEQMAALHPYGEAGHAGAFTPKPKEKVCATCKFRALCPAAVCTTP
jgi:hypothetical protein